MALRHPFPEICLSGITHPAEPDQMVPVPRKPKTINFRGGKDMAALCHEMTGFSFIEVIAATGAGKSTMVPLELSRTHEVPVVHVVPSRCLAVHIFDYLQASENGKEFHLSLVPADGIAASGVTITYCANLSAIILAKTTGSVFVEYPRGVIVYMDECHESDGFTYFNVRSAQYLAGVNCLIKASATHEPERIPMAELKGESTSEYFKVSEPPSRWDPADLGKPWSVTSFDDNVLVYVDEEASAQQLIYRFNRAGVTAYRLSARMNVDAFRRIYKSLTDPKSGIIVMVADYSFRSGYTFPVSRIIDSCTVQYCTIEEGRQVFRTRAAFKIERYQAQHRGARTAGSQCRYYHPLMDAPNAICSLEGIEVELAAVLFRYAGYRPPPELQIASMAVGNVPYDLVKAFNGSVALPLLSADELVPLVEKRVSRNLEDIVEEVVRGYSEITPPGSPKDLFSFGDDADEHTPTVAEGGLQFLQQLKKLSGERATLVAGRYYTTPGLQGEEVTTQLYGSDWKKALMELTSKAYMISGLSRVQRIEIIALFLSEYNTNVAVAAGIENMLQAQDGLTRLATRYPDYVSEWSDYVGEKLREAKAAQVSLIQGLELLRTPGMVFLPTMPRTEMESKISKTYADRLMFAIQGVDKVVDGDKYLKYIEGRITDVDPPPDKEYDKLVLQGDDQKQYILVKSVPVSAGSRRLWDLEFRVKDGLMWPPDQCEEALAYYLTTVGLSTQTVRSVEFVGTRVDSRKVLRSLRDRGEFRHRPTLTHKFELSEKARKRITMVASNG